MLNNNDWDTISAASKGNIADKIWSAGDWKKITMNGSANITLSNWDVKVFIIDFNHTYAQGKTIFQIGKRNNDHIAFIDNSYDVGASPIYRYVMNQTTPIESFFASSMYTSHLYRKDYGFPTLLPSDLRNVLQTYNFAWPIRTDSGYYTSSASCYSCLLSEYNMFGKNTSGDEYEKYTDTYYAYYKAGNPKQLKQYSDTSKGVTTWLRSKPYGNSLLFVTLLQNGVTSTQVATTSLGISPVFCV